MRHSLSAACISCIGKGKAANNDNFYFSGKCLEQQNRGMRKPAEAFPDLQDGFCTAVFCAVPNSSHGETASFVAAEALRKFEKASDPYCIPERTFLKRMTAQLNTAVAAEASLSTGQAMGTSFCAVYFSTRSVYVSNLGTCRIYRLRCGEFMQLSEDHVSKDYSYPAQYLGTDSRDLIPEPFIAKGDLRNGDTYLLCSTGLTDALTNLEIACILTDHADPYECAAELTDSAAKKCPQNDITVIVCRIE